MGAALYPVLESQIGPLDPALEVSGKMLSRHSKALEEICTQTGVKPLMAFYSESKDETIAHLFDEPSEELSAALDKIQLEWFDPADGLTTVRALLKNLAAKTEDWSPRVIEDLRALENVLGKAQESKVRFRLRLDL